MLIFLFYSYSLFYCWLSLAVEHVQPETPFLSPRPDYLRTSALMEPALLYIFPQSPPDHREPPEWTTVWTCTGFLRTSLTSVSKLKISICKVASDKKHEQRKKVTFMNRKVNQDAHHGLQNLLLLDSEELYQTPTWSGRHSNPLWPPSSSNFLYSTN